MPDAPLRIGVLRSTNASPDPVVALAEARVIRHELQRRLDQVGVDFRTTGAADPPWQPLEHAAWPSDVDAVLDLDTVPAHVSLTRLYARTLDHRAVDVRRRMLHHLGLLPIATVDDAWLGEHLPPPRRPTDVWIALRESDEVQVSDPCLGSLAADDDQAASTLDEWFDRFVEGLDTDVTPTIERLRLRVGELERALVDATSEAARVERLADERIRALEAEGSALRERLERTVLDVGVG